MTQEEKDRIAYMISVMQAYKEGKEIESSYLSNKIRTWSHNATPRFNWVEFDYRIKPEPPKPQYRPFENAEEVMEAIKEHGDWVRVSDGTYTVIVNVLKDGRLFLGESVSSCSYNYMLEKNYTFVDGTPFGKLIEK